MLTKDELLRMADAVRDDTALISAPTNPGRDAVLRTVAAYLREQAEADPAAAFRACWARAFALGGYDYEARCSGMATPGAGGTWTDKVQPRLDAGEDLTNPETWR